MSLAGLPPLSGFWGKLMIIQEGFTQSQWTLVVCSLVASILTLVSMLKIWLGAFWRGTPSGPVCYDRRARAMTAVGLAMVAVSLTIGLGAEIFLRVADRAARETLDRPGYVRTVLGANATLYQDKQP